MSALLLDDALLKSIINHDINATLIIFVQKIMLLLIIGCLMVWNVIVVAGGQIWGQWRLQKNRKTAARDVVTRWRRGPSRWTHMRWWSIGRRWNAPSPLLTQIYSCNCLMWSTVDVAKWRHHSTVSSDAHGQLIDTPTLTLSPSLCICYWYKTTFCRQFFFCKMMSLSVSSE